MASANKEVLFGLYDDEEILLTAVQRAKDDHLDIMDVYSPFPCLLYTSPSPRDLSTSRMPSSA